jgi:2-polyprenyl-3-methyl-5-hydroxy-6-metoxy-1,4-benzoquinol methylase
MNPVHAFARKIPGLRSGWYLAHELRRMLKDTSPRRRAHFETLFRQAADPWQYESDPGERQRFEREMAMILSALDGKAPARALEIGCAEGAFTAHLAPRCRSLLAMDASETALARARACQAWPPHVIFTKADLEHDALPGSRDLIVVTGVLDHISRPGVLRELREKLVGALEPGGLLLIGNPPCNEVVDNAWWGRALIRGGKWIARFFAEDPRLKVVAECSAAGHLDLLLKRTRDAS